MARVSLTCALVLLSCVTALCQGAAREANEFPTRPLRIVVPFAPGGTNDIVARVLGPALTDALGQQIVVDNRTGASGNIGTQLVANAQPNGYTILLGNVGTNAINPTLFPSESGKPLIPVTLLATASNLLVSGVKFGPQNFKELVAWAKANPGKLNYNNTYGSHGHLSMLELALRIGLEIVNVPIQGGGAGLTSLMSGEVHCGLLSAAAVVQLIHGGRLKAFVTTSEFRLLQLPEVPTLGEVGFPGLASLNWLGFFLPVGTSSAIVEKMHKTSVEAMQRPDVKNALASRLIQTEVSGSPNDFEKFVNAETKRWTEIIQRNHIKNQ